MAIWGKYRADPALGSIAATRSGAQNQNIHRHATTPMAIARMAADVRSATSSLRKMRRI